MIDPFVVDLADFNMPIQLVLDGALVSNIDERLKFCKLDGRPLFRNNADRATVLAGPWLISLNPDQRPLERAVIMARSVGKGVFWLGHSDDALLFQHLRRLGAARMPDGRILYFRHYDSDVLAAIAPLLDSRQAAVLFGPCQIIALIGGSGNRATIHKPDGLPKETPYPIEFQSWQISVLDERQLALSRKKIARMLREELPDKMPRLADDDTLVKGLCEQATTMNMKTESSQARWCYMHYLSNGKINSEFLAANKNSGYDEFVLEEYFKKIINGFSINKSRSLQEYFE